MIDIFIVAIAIRLAIRHGEKMYDNAMHDCITDIGQGAYVETKVISEGYEIYTLVRPWDDQE